MEVNLSSYKSCRTILISAEEIYRKFTMTDILEQLGSHREIIGFRLVKPGELYVGLFGVVVQAEAGVQQQSPRLVVRLKLTQEIACAWFAEIVIGNNLTVDPEKLEITYIGCRTNPYHINMIYTFLSGDYENRKVTGEGLTHKSAILALYKDFLEEE